MPTSDEMKLLDAGDWDWKKSSNRIRVDRVKLDGFFCYSRLARINRVRAIYPSEAENVF